MKMITQEYLKSLFSYNGSDLVWKQTRGMAKTGSVAGTINSRGYRHIRIDNKFYQAHRLIWIYFNGSLEPEATIDHIDRNRSNNSISNLRIVSKSENNLNSARSDHYNVGVRKDGSKFVATFRFNSLRHYIGRFTTETEAIEARKKFIENLGR
jgi:hypothetical protein